MKKLHYLYADFETLAVDIPKEYKNEKDYFENHPNPKKPKIYDWNVTYDKEYPTLGEHNFKESDEVKKHSDINEDTFINFVENLTVDALMFFNNLKGFDGHFLIPILDKAGYVNVLPYNITDIKELDENLKLTYTKRLLKFKEICLKHKQIREKYNELKILSTESANEYLYGCIEKRWKTLLPKEYSVMTDGGKHIYEIKIGIADKKTTKGKTKNRALIVRDNLLLFPTSIANMGQTLVKHYHGICDCYKKGNDHCKDLEGRTELDNKYLKKDLSSGYKRYEPYNSYEELVNDGNELEYLEQDTYILWKFHKVIEEYFPRSQWAMTIGSTAYKEWVSMLGEELLDKAINANQLEVIELKRGAFRFKDKKGKLHTTTSAKEMLIRKILPTSWLDKTEDGEKLHDILYEYYDGGITMVNEKYRGQYVDNITFLDINSSYPSQMVKDDYVPIGRGMKGNVKGYDYKFYTLIPNKKIYNKSGLPFLHNKYAQTREYLKVLEPNTVYKFTSHTYKRFLKYYSAKETDYNLTIDYSFQQTKIKNLFEPFINKWYAIKEKAGIEGNEVLKMIAKLFLNSLYGKFGTKSLRVSMLWNQQLEQWESYNQELKSKYYLPIGIIITELARMALVDAVDDNYENFCYTDTDSIAVTNYRKEDYKNIILHPSKLGMWDIEFDNAYGIFRRPKQYMLLNGTKKAKIAFAGMNFNRLAQPDSDDDTKILQELTLKDFILGKTIPNQTSAYRLLGHGITINTIDKDIKPVWDYRPLSQQIYFKHDHFLKSLEKISQCSKISI